ncbi:DNA polymerase III subunit psi [Shewanella sp. KX20019]|uniref:DNA polymerase III subunit psi n=1 Tax=Shewanella sp. KX20019 TaxID=2803864 RepID=UPI001928E8A7|nr:DNA polymerase III subunit psi [Shewanella sp. KX20019]QQX79298.1 DNA polymerase III subunit psi [Shewanella sp. KX20019]
MKSSDYLDAMGITRWVKPELKAEISTVLVSPRRLTEIDSPIISKVLEMLGYDREHIRFATSADKHSKVIWDMRGKPVQYDDNILMSAPINEIESNPEAKKLLWRNMQPFIVQKDSE